jgi:hypothetical protein
MTEVKSGQMYEHFKGNKYVVLCVARDSADANKKIVVYAGAYTHPEYGYAATWTRPLDEFLSNKIIDGKEVPRFKLVL